MGVIWNPEKISYMLDTHIIDFGGFQFFCRGAPGGGGEGRYISVLQNFRNSNP